MKGDKRMSTEAVLPTSTASPKEGPPKKKRKLSFPTAFTILFALTIVAVAATWFVPAGQYAKLAYNADAGTLQISADLFKLCQLRYLLILKHQGSNGRKACACTIAFLSISDSQEHEQVGRQTGLRMFLA